MSLANYGYVAQFVTRMPENDLAAACLMDLHKYGVRTDHVVFGGERLGIYFLETGAVSRPGKVVYDRAHSSMAGIRPGMIDWERVFEGASWFHWTGITPAISAGAAEACREAVEAANRMQVPVSCDLNYRDKLWKYGKTAAEVMPRLVAGCDVAIANEEDAEKVFGIKPEGFDAATAGGGRQSPLRGCLPPAHGTFPASAEGGRHPARVDQREPQHLGRGALRRTTSLPFETLRHHAYRRSCGRRRPLPAG